MALRLAVELVAYAWRDEMERWRNGVMEWLFCDGIFCELR